MSVDQISAVTMLVLSVYPTQASSLGRLITFANNFHFNLVVILVSFLNQSSVVNLFLTNLLYYSFNLNYAKRVVC